MRKRLAMAVAVAITLMSLPVLNVSVVQATTVIRATVPGYVGMGGIKQSALGTNSRNSTCNALACEDRTYLERSSWTGFRKVDSSERFFSRKTGTACLNGTYDWKTAHRARYITDAGAQIGITVDGNGFNIGSNGPQWSKWFSHWSGTQRFETVC
jgi:hypothetical protein